MSERIINPWPELNFQDLKGTIETVHLFSQIIGKIRLQSMPWLNHSWHVTLYLSARGLTTGSVPYSGGLFEIEMDFIDHQVVIRSSEGTSEQVSLYPRTVADFYHELFQKLDVMGISIVINGTPNELAESIPFKKDNRSRQYDLYHINNFWKALIRIEIVFTRFRSKFTGKVSPVHFFWGSFDLAVTRFSGRTAPLYPGGVPNIPDDVMQEAYSHEVSSCGFWPGAEDFPVPCFYSYAYPVPEDYGSQPVQPAAAFFSKEKGEFFLPYEAVQKAGDPEETLMLFLQSTFAAAAMTGNWDNRLECDLSGFEKRNLNALKKKDRRL